MEFEESFDRALRSADPLQALRLLAQELVSQGYSQTTVVELFESARQQLRAANRDLDEDAVLDVMDFLAGWCSPHMTIRPEPREAGQSDGAAMPARGHGPAPAPPPVSVGRRSPRRPG